MTPPTSQANRPTTVPKPRLRSVLYTPGDRGDRVEKALRETGPDAADVLLADLEDAVAFDRKGEARRQVAAAFSAVPATGRSLRGVRINVWPGQLANDDLAAVLPLRPDVIAVP
jgi:citrate lyase subunit beta / citryl-CoA lyase